MQDYEQTLLDSNPTILNFDFTAQLLALDLTFGNKRSTWYQAGYVTPLVNVGGNFYEGTAIKLRFDKQMLEIPYLAYRLRFETVDWARDVNINIKQLLSKDYKSMSISYPPVQRVIGAEAVSTAAAATTNAVGLAANADRAPGSFVINYANKIAYVNQSSTAAVAGRPSTPIPANGGVFQITYPGAINIIFASGATGSAEFHEFSYV
jgi:hypothetical protein